MPPPNTRKRPAPGSSPAVQAQAMQQDFSTPQMTNEQFLRWSQPGDGTQFAEPYNMNAYVGNPASNSQFPPATAVTSTQLARRPVSRQMLSNIPRTTFDNSNDPWGSFGDDTIMDQQNPNGMEETDNIDVLEERAVIAKRDAQSKRKQIPPFVQKLSSFLDESKNTDLIRWSERGDSFVVLDEDEFAKTLIPELFKHNNYASFVRQLNMYGFHKRVGLSDNSMKASERKNKTPSEYYNPYFKRGHPNLLWLINKPKGGTGQKKGKSAARAKPDDGVDGESDDDRQDGVDETFGTGYIENNLNNIHRAISAAPEAGALQRRDLTLVQNQLQEIQKQQGAISSAISRLRKDHNQLYQQAVAFQTLHDRHESSINAILTFLATVYNRSLDTQGGPNIAQMFGNAIPQDQQHQGNVVSNVMDIGDLSNPPHQKQNQGSLSPLRKPQRLLMAPPSATSPSSSTQSSRPQNRNYQATANVQQHGAVEELFESPPSESPQAKADIDSLPQRNMMSIINSANAQSIRPGGRNMNFPDVLSHFENSNGNSPLTSEQRSDMLQLIASQASTPGSNNALVSPAPSAPSLEPFKYTQQELNELSRMQRVQEDNLRDVTSVLAPLSPSGSIPGINDNQYFPEGGVSPSGGNNLDLDQFLDTSAFYTNGDGGEFNYDGMDFNNADPGSFDFGLDQSTDNVSSGGVHNNDIGRIVESQESSEGSGDGQEENAHGAGQRSPSKRRRKG